MSLALSALAVLLGLSNNGDHQIEKEEILKALDDIDGLHNMLRTAKNAHDKFQVLQSFFSDRPEMDKRRYDKMDKHEQRELCEKLLGAPKTLNARISTSDSGIIDPTKASEFQVPDGLDSSVKASAVSAIEKYSELYNALVAYEKIYDGKGNSLSKMIDNDDFGESLRLALRSLESTVDRAAAAADQVIVDITPVLTSTHHAVKTAVAKLR